MMRVAIVGGGMAGLAAAYELEKLRTAGSNINFTLFEMSKRLGGTVETHRQDGFVIECGPDGWVTEKPWARELAEELGLGDEIIHSRDDERVTWVVRDSKLLSMPDNMRMMVPESIDSIMDSPLFSDAARAAYAAEPSRADELKATAPGQDESVASFITRHFGEEVSRVIGAPLLGGVFGGDVHRLSVRAVMPAFVQMEREYGSLILALQQRTRERGNKPRPTVFTSLKTGTGTLAERMAAMLPPQHLRMQRQAVSIQRTANGWLLRTAEAEESFDHLMLAVPVHVASTLLYDTDARSAELIPNEASSAVIAGFGFSADKQVHFPQGFGFLSPEGEDCQLLAATFADQKFSNRVPPGGKSLRAFFGGSEAERLMHASDDEVITAARAEFAKVLGPLPDANVTIVRRWPNSLPQYGVGHLERMAELQQRVDGIGALHLLGNGYRGVGLPDLIRDGRAAARSLVLS